VQLGLVIGSARQLGGSAHQGAMTCSPRQSLGVDQRGDLTGVIVLAGCSVERATGCQPFAQAVARALEAWPSSASLGIPSCRFAVLASSASDLASSACSASASGLAPLAREIGFGHQPIQP
jgi:hypothetical protein